MNKVFNVIQVSNVDGEILVNVTPCEDLKAAQEVMSKEIDTLLSESPKYQGLDLEKAEKETQDEDMWDNEFNLDRSDTHFYLTCNTDDYSEYIDIEEKEIVKAG